MSTEGNAVLCLVSLFFPLQERKTSKKEVEKIKQELKQMEEDHIRYTFLYIFFTS